MMNNGPKSTNVAGARVALYATGGSTLLNCARYAERSGLRVVTMIEKPEVSSGLGGAGLDALVGRLDDGEFEVIVADAGDGRVVTIAGVSFGNAQSAAFLDRAEIADLASHEEVARIPAKEVPSVWRLMVMQSIREATVQKRLGLDRKRRSSLAQMDKKVEL